LDISKEYQYKRNFGGARRSILERDRYSCRICGNDRQKSLVVHHKDDQGYKASKPNNNPDNLIVLCRNCHAAITKLRKYDTGLSVELLLYPKSIP
jgi:5-methylcytosine-specific restriction endonuclease McrA